MLASGVQKVLFCSLSLDTLTLHSLIELFDDACQTRSQRLVFHHNLHSLYLLRRDAALRRAYSLATHTYADGMPIVWLARAAGLPFATANRITYMDSFGTLLEHAAERRWRVFYLGATASVLQRGLEQLRRRFPQLVIDGHHGYFDKRGEQNDQVLEQIRGFRPDLLFVGMGMPTQEIWLADHFHRLDVPVVTTCGATLEYITGSLRKPPLWAGSLGLQWLFRLLGDPRRVWRRYLLEPLALLFPLLTCVLRERRSTKGHG